MTIERFIREAGSDVAQGGDDPTMLLIGAKCKPEWIDVPAHLGSLSGRKTCTAMIINPCPVHEDHDCVHYILDGPVSVAECGNQFYWYSRKAGG